MINAMKENVLKKKSFDFALRIVKFEIIKLITSSINTAKKSINR